MVALVASLYLLALAVAVDSGPSEPSPSTDTLKSAASPAPEHLPPNQPSRMHQLPDVPLSLDRPRAPTVQPGEATIVLDAVALKEALAPSAYAETNDGELWAEVVQAWCYPAAIESEVPFLDPLYVQYLDIAVRGW